MTPTRPTRQNRLSAAIAVGVLYGVWTVVLLALKRRYGQDSWAADFTHPWIAARALFDHRSPYQAVYEAYPPYGRFFLYPLPAALLTVPVALLPLHAAAGVAVAIAVTLLAYAVTRHAYWPLLMFVSAPALRIADSVQIWAPLFTAAAILSPLLGLVAAKPHVGLPVLAYQKSVRPIAIAAVVGAGLFGASFVVYPPWFAEWWTVLRTAPQTNSFRPPILNPLGALSALALLRWRRPEARLLLASAVLPQSPYFYDQVPLLLIPGSRWEMLVFVAVSQIAAAFAPIDVAGRRWYMIAGLYLPALVMILIRKNAPPSGETYPPER